MSWLFLAVLIKVLLTTENPPLCAGLYAVTTLAMNLVIGTPAGSAVIHGLLSLVWAFGYFWVLQRLADTRMAWWSAMIGIPIASAVIFQAL